MTDDHQLTPPEIAAAEPADWRYVLGRLKTRFRTPDFATGSALVADLGSLTAEGRRPQVTLSETDVVVAVPGRADAGITRGDVEAAERITEAARRHGATPDPGGVTQVELGLDTSGPDGLAPYYAALLGSEVQRGEPVDVSGQAPTVWWQTPEPADDGDPLPDPVVPQRWHLDVWVGHDEGPRRLQAVLDAGGRLVSDAAAPSYWVIEDADGNRSCICTPANRDG
ncbi:VOC family protein [Phycicoccus flavus]|uniref:VOC family protein n=1 Tax=Phycicoccus flavus TaxID=2502783 RepID=UPI000FEB7A3C|nr:VOC family protein [Phycicoccus flavus]NHA68855.1 4a-hydroxytetrahydrobiopterin dehydratase [Phycicoccus flavus]